MRLLEQVARPYRVMVVEDNALTRKLTCQALLDRGYAVPEAPDARTALALVSDSLPDLILQDLILPDMDGFDLFARLRAVRGGAEVPILAFTGFLSSHDESRAPFG